MSKIMNVFYGADCLPYKDKERQVHYPIVGQGFQGASNTTEIKFYIDQIGAIDDSWVAIAKLPNGKVGSKLLSDIGEDENGQYVSLELSSFYTQYVGNLFISLQGYRGGVEVEYDSDTELYVIHGTPTIEATGPIKLAINYSTQYNGSDEDEQITVQEALAIVSTKLDKISPRYFKVVSELPDVVTDQDLEYLNVGDILFSKSQTGFFRIVTLSPTPTYERISASFDDLTAYGGLGVQGDTELQYLDVYSGAEFYDDVNFDKNINVANTIFITNFDYIEDGNGNTLKDELDGKVNKTNAANKVYGTNGSGEQTNIPVDYGSNFGGKVVRRDSNDQIYVPLQPTANGHAASKKFVEDSIGTAMTSVLIYQGTKTVAQINALDTSTLKTGYFYNVSDSGIIILGNVEVLAGDNICWTGTGWDKLTMDLSVYDDKFIAAGFFEVQNYNEEEGTITFVYASDLYSMSYSESTGILTIEAN